MAGFLDEYGVADARRNRIVKQVLLWGLLVIVVGGSGFFYFRNWSEERRIDQFLGLLKEQKYQDAYALWDSPDTRKYYTAEKFIEDWGPQGAYKNAAALKVEEADSCDAGVVFSMAYPNVDNFGLWVARDSKVISFAPWARCPGPHLQVIQFLRSRFGGR